MGYFDGLTDAIFKKDSNGSTLFYPSGVMGRGYIIPSEERATATRRYIKVMYMILLPAMIITMTVGGLLWTIPFVIGFPIWYYGFAVKKLTKDLEPSNERLTPREATVNSASSHSLATLIVLEVISILFVIGGLFMILSTDDLVIALACTAFFGLCAGRIAVMIQAKLKSRTSS